VLTETLYFCVGKESKDARCLTWAKTGVVKERVAFFPSLESAWVTARDLKLHVFAVDVVGGRPHGKLENVRCIVLNEESPVVPAMLILDHLGELAVRLGDSIRKGGALCA